MKDKPGDRGLWAIFRWPLLLAWLSLAGLLAALLGDGIWDALGWALLAPALALGLLGLLKARMRR
jgi:hypothetical protein